MQVLELDVRDVRIVEERSSAAVMETTSGAVSEDPLAGHAQRKHFLYFRDEKIFSVLMEICRTLGQSSADPQHTTTSLMVRGEADVWPRSRSIPLHRCCYDPKGAHTQPRLKPTANCLYPTTPLPLV